MLGVALLVCGLVGASSARADVKSPDGVWTALDIMPAAQQRSEPWVRPVAFKALRLERDMLKAELSMAPMEHAGAKPMRITLPRPEGGFESFDIVEYSMMEPGLAAAFPEIKTYYGQCLEEPAANVYLDWTPLGFHAQVLSPTGGHAIDPYSKGDTTYYSSYFFTDLKRADGFRCETMPDFVAVPEGAYAGRSTGTMLRTYRLAMAATASFCGYYGGASQAQAGIVTGVNRINQVYENEFSIRLTLVANNQNLMFTDSATQPYTDGNLSTMLGQNQTTVNSVIGSGNYDVGHVVSGINTGGLAQLRAVCTSSKARGGTGLAQPTGDFFWVEYTSHELGHEFGANHSFNADDSADGNVCLPNRNSATAYEPGGGSTIMSYTNLCGGHNQLQSTSDPMFNQGAYAEITAYIGTGLCAVNTATGNTPPTVNGGVDRTIPMGTPVAMTATSGDANGDSLTFSWEERDLGAAQPAIGTGSEDNGASPLFRVFAPVTSMTRNFPKSDVLVSGITMIGERIPTAARTMHLRVTARDNRAGGGGVNTDDVNLTVSAAGPFRVTFPNASMALFGTQTVTWDVAGTNLTPVSCANVKISLSTDRGFTFPTVLLASTPNTGSAQITLPEIQTDFARIRVEAIGNVFYDISDIDFVITGLQVPTDLHAIPGTICEGDSSILTGTVPAGQIIDWFSGVCGSGLIGSGPSISVSPTTSMIYRARARVLATGEVGNACAVTFVNVNELPDIAQQPAVQNVVVGQQATFSVDATNGDTFQWRRNTVNLADGGSLAGATGPTLTISAAQPSDAGSYDVIVGNSCGSVTSDPAMLTVGSPCGSADFNGDGDVGTDSDIESFFACLSGACCATCGSADFNGDGDLGTDSDIEAFFRVLGGGGC
jgi:hypothetical protein